LHPATSNAVRDRTRLTVSRVADAGECLPHHGQ